MTLLEIFTANPKAVAVRRDRYGGEVRVCKAPHSIHMDALSIRRRHDERSEWDLTNWTTDDLGDGWTDVTVPPGTGARRAA